MKNKIIQENNWKIFKFIERWDSLEEVVFEKSVNIFIYIRFKYIFDYKLLINDNFTNQFCLF